MTWVCVHCQTPVNGTRFDPWCPTCQDKTIATDASPLTYEQYRAICDLFTSIGEINRGKRLRWISQAIGRAIRDYGDLTSAEGDAAHTKLKERVHGVRR